jgi:hypothetical protein
MQKLCEFCGEYAAKHLQPMENGPNWGLSLENGSDDYCTHDCWEKDIRMHSELRRNN